MRLLLPQQFIWRPSVPHSFSSSGTHRINTCRNVTVTWCQCIPSQGVNCVRLGAWLCKHWDCSPPHNSFGDHPSPSSPSSGTHRINPPMKHNWLLRWIHWHQVQWHTRYWFCECQSWRTGDGWSPNELCGGEQSHAYIIKHPISTQLTPCDGIHWHQVQWHSYMYWILWVPELENWGTDGLQMNCVGGEQSHAYIIKHPISTTIDSLWWNTLTSGTVTFLHYWFCEWPELENWGTDGLQMNCVGRAVSCLHNQAPNWNTIDSLWWNTTHIRYSDITTCIDSVSARAAQWRTECVSKCIVWGRAVSCLHNQAPNWNIMTPCDGIHWHQVQWHYYVYWFCELPEQHNWRTDGLQMNCVRESSLMLT